MMLFLFLDHPSLWFPDRTDAKDGCGVSLSLHMVSQAKYSCVGAGLGSQMRSQSKKKVVN